MKETRPDYFAPTTPVETILRQIKGNMRRAMVIAAVEQDGIDTIPEPWLAHDLSDVLRNTLGRQHPNYRGGEDLPDLFEGEVEVARLSLVDSVHGEVNSLRARHDDNSIHLRIVDEYWDASDEEYKLEKDSFSESLTAQEVLTVFLKSEPCACLSSCEQRFSSDFYSNLDELANELDIKQVWED
jgi:hypothetical protein